MLNVRILNVELGCRSGSEFTTVALLDQKVGREVQGLEEKLERGFSETQAMIRFSHAELDRRVGPRALQQTIPELQSRVERIESSAQ